jgi:FkbM family methyltransferase
MQSDTQEIYYDQDTEVQLLTNLLGHLDDKKVIDVGAEHGSFVGALLQAGADAVYAFEPYPPSVEILRSTYGDTPAVHVFDMAVGASEGRVTLHVVEDKTGHAADAYHSLVAFEETPTLRLAGEVAVQCRTLDSLVAEGALPAKVGILKVDTERSDFAVLQGMGKLTSDVVMIEFWEDLAETVGPAVYKVADVAAFMAKRGYTNFVVIKRHDQFETLQVNTTEVRSGDWGNVLFIHDSAFARLGPALFQAAAAAQFRLIDKAVFFADEAQKRQALLVEAQSAAAERQRLLEEFRRTAEAARRAAEERQRLLEEAQQAADERLRLLEEAQQAADERLRQALDQEAGQIVTTRLTALTEQEQAIDAYLRVSRDDGLWRRVPQQLGVLYQHDPVPFHVPEHYLDVIPLSRPPSISMVTPCLNSAAFLPLTMESILDQEYPALEYVVQDGGSRDGTLSVVERYRGRLAHVASEQDSGMAQAINRGFAHTSGEIMAYLNADDLLLPGALHYIGAYFARHPEVDVIYGHRVVIDAANAEVGRWILPPHDDAVLSWVDYVPQETLFWRRSIWEKAGGGMDESFRFAVDWDLLLRFRSAGARFARLPRFLGAFRVHAEQKTARELRGLGFEEMDRLREREVGRPVSRAEARPYLDDYLRHHKLYHKLYRLGVLRY